MRLGEILPLGSETLSTYQLQPKEFVLASTLEWVNIPNYLVGRIEGKSSLARQGLIIHIAGFIDPGFRGNLTLEITNLGKYKSFPLKSGMLIAQIAFTMLNEPAVRPYGHPELKSHYQDQTGVTEARM